MFSRVKNFITRHKRKFILTGLLFGGTYVTIQYIQKKLQEFQEKQAKEFFDKSRRVQHFDSIEKTCNQTIVSLSPSLCDEIFKRFKSEEILEKLRKKPDNRIELWDELKMLSFTKLTIMIYSSSMLVVTLRTQMNLLGGYLYNDTINEITQITEDMREAYLSTINFFFECGIRKLADMIETKVRNILNNYKLQQKLSLSDIEQIFYQIQMAVNYDVYDPNSKICYYVLPKNLASSNHDLLNKMFNETIDLLESEDVSVILSNNASRGFSIAADNIAELYSNFASKSNLTNTKELQLEEFSNMKDQLNSVLNINNVELPLAKIIPYVNDIASEKFDSANKPNLPTSLITLYLVSDKIKIFGANVYEVFSI